AAFGQPIAENPTQAMVEAAYRHHGLDWRYLTIEVSREGLADAVRGARAMGFRGSARGQELVTLLRDKVKADARLVVWNGDFDIPAGTDVVINATSIGLYPDVGARLALNTATLKPE